MVNTLALANHNVNRSSVSHQCLAAANVKCMNDQSLQDQIYNQRRAALIAMIDAEAKARGLNGAVRRVADRLDIDRSLLSQIKGGYRNCGEDLALKIGAKLGNQDWWRSSETAHTLFDANVEPAPKPIRKVPLISCVAAGRLTEAMDPYALGACEDEVPVYGEVSGYSFALRIKGDSMEPEFTEGDVVIIDPDVRPQPGDFVVAKNHEEEATFKKYRPRGRNEQGVEYFELVPLNENYAPMRSDLEHLHIIGTMVMSIKKRRAKPHWRDT